MRSARCGAISTASTRAPSIAAREPIRAALPPGPAHRSSQRPASLSTGTSVSALAMSWDPSSCTAASPSRTSASAAGSPPVKYTAYGEYLPCWPPVVSASSSALISPGRATRCNSGRCESALSADSSSTPARLPSASANERAIHSGWAWRNASAANSPSGSSFSNHSRAGRRAIARNTPFTNPFALIWFAASAKRTEVSTAA